MISTARHCSHREEEREMGLRLRAQGFFTLAGPALLIALISLSVPVWAQVGSGSLEAVTEDQEGGLLPGVSLQVMNEDSGLRRVGLTGGQGSAVFLALPPGSYTLTANLDSFAPVVKEGLTILVGQEVRLRITMEVQLSDTITVSARPPQVDIYKTDSSVNIVPEQIENLPVSDRDFQKLAFIAPGVVREQVEQAYERATPVLGGSGGTRNTAVFIDGVDLTDPGGGSARVRFSQESIREFRVIMGRFDSEIGGSTAGALSIVTKTGGNQTHGSAFGFYRADSLRAKGEFAQDKLDYQRYQVGFTVGGAFIPDKLHYFVSVERIDEEDIYPFRPGGAFVDLAEDVENPFDQNLALVNINHQLNQGLAGVFKLAFERYREDNFQLGAKTHRSALFAFHRDNWNLTLGLTWVFGDGNSLDEVRLQHGERDYQHIINSHEVGEWFSSGQTMEQGASFYGDFIVNGCYWELRNTFHRHLAGASSTHDLKFGFSFFHLKEYADLKLFQDGLFVYATDDRSLPLVYKFGVGSGATALETDIIGIFFQDDWRPAANFTLSLGLRYDYDSKGNNPDFSHPLVGSRSPDSDNIQPRIGFSWDIGGNGKSILRGGGGIFTGRYRAQAAQYELQQNGDTGRIIYTNSNGAAFGLPPETWLDPDDPENTGMRRPPDITLMEDSLETPEAWQLNAGYTHRLGATGLYLEAEAVYLKGDNEIISEDVNFGGNDNPVRLNPDYNQITVFTNSGSSEYKAFVLSLNGVLDGGHMITGSVTLGDKKNIADDFERIYPSDSTDVEGEWGSSRSDNRLRITFSGVFKLPWDLTLASIFEYSSGPPWNRTYGYDYNGDGQYFDRPPGVSRYAEDGPSFQQLSLRLTKTFHFSHTGQIDLIVEGFNLFNHTNYEVTSVDDGEYIIGPTLANPDDPYVENPTFGQYRATYPPREIQIGVRYRF